MQVGFAGGGSLLDFVDTSSLGLSVGIGPKETYQELLNLQSSRVPLDVVTGKRIYTNMLIRALEVTTDRTSENILSAVLTLREVIITSITTTQVAPKSNMKLGANTSAVQNSGVKTPVQKNESILSRLSGFVAGG